MARLWQPHEDSEILRLRSEGMMFKQIAERFGASVDSVEHRVKRLRKRAPEVDIPIHVEEPRTAPPQPDVSLLVRLAKPGVSLEQLCDRLGMSPAKAREMVAEAQRQGFRVDIDGPHVGHRPAQSSPEVHSVAIAAAGERRVFAQITDLHFGSRYHLGAQLRDFVAMAYARGVRTMLVTGDVLEGCYRHAQWELTHHGFHDQANFCAETLPEHPGLSYHFITGNHDQTFSDANGMSVGHALVDVFHGRGRSDLVFHGDRGARLAIKANASERGIIVDLWHPLKGPAYALSYKLQKYVEGMPVGRKADVVFAGHWHQSVFFTTRGVHAFSGGCFQGGGGPYGKALGGSPSIGGWIVEYAQTEGGTIRRLAPEWIGYFEHETAREVAV